MTNLCPPLCIQNFFVKATNSKTNQRIGNFCAIFLKERIFLTKDIENLCICQPCSLSGAVANCLLGTQCKNVRIWVKHSPVPPREPVTFDVLFIILFKVSNVWLFYTCQIFTIGQVLFGHLEISPFAQDVAVASATEVSCCGRNEDCLATDVHWIAKLCQSISKIITIQVISSFLHAKQTDCHVVISSNVTSYCSSLSLFFPVFSY